ncbi:MAG: hypothetical protein GC203_11900 [Phenylobacterium sp.]|nr:hypothetical protein [Phenylobacterium sp.]
MAVAAAATLVSIGGASAQPASPPDRAEVTQRLEGAVERLHLTAEQRTRAEPIMRASFQRRQALVEKARADGSISMREARSLRSALQGETERMMRDLDGVLTPTQLAELNTMEDEMRAQARARLASRR